MTIFFNKILLILVVLLSFGEMKAQYVPEWAKGFGGDKRDKGRAVTETPEGDILVTGEVAKRRTNMWMIKLSAEGKKIWGKTYENNFSSNANAVDCASNNNIFLAGKYIKSWRNQDINGFIMKTDSLGQKIWLKQYGGRLTDEFKDMIVSSTGDIVAVGYSDGEEEDSGKELWFIRTDSTGEVLSEARFCDSDEDVANAVIESKDGNFIIGGYAFMAEKKLLRIMKVTPEGEAIWDLPFNIDRIKEIHDIVEFSDGSVYACGMYRVMPLTDYNDLLVKISENGELLYLKTYGNYNWEEATSLVKTHDNQLIMCGFEKSADELYADFKIRKVDTAGNELFVHTFNKRSIDYPEKLIETQDKGLVLAGSTYHNENGWDYAVLKYKYLRQTDTEFISPEEEISSTSELTIDVKICINGFAPPQKADIYLNDLVILTDIYNPAAIAEDKCLYPVYATIPLQIGQNRIKVFIVDEHGFTVDDEIEVFYIPEDNLNW